jgi:hypothetical protein
MANLDTKTIENFPHLTCTDKNLLETARNAGMRFARIKSTPVYPNGYVAAIGCAEGINKPTHGWNPDAKMWKQFASADGVPIKETA